MNSTLSENHLDFTRQLKIDGVLDAFATPGFGLKLEILTANLNAIITSCLLLEEHPLNALGINAKKLIHDLKQAHTYLNVQKTRFYSYERSWEQECGPYPLVPFPNVNKGETVHFLRLAQNYNQERHQIQERQIDPIRQQAFINEAEASQHLTEQIRLIRQQILDTEREKLAALLANEKPKTKRISKKPSVKTLFTNKNKKAKTVDQNPEPTTFDNCIESISQGTSQSYQNTQNQQQERPLVEDLNYFGGEDLDLPNYVDFLHSQEPIRPTVEYSTFTGEQTVQQEVQYNNTEAYYQNYPQEIQYENLVQPREIITREKYTKTIGELVKRQKRQDIELGNIQPTFTQLN